MIIHNEKQMLDCIGTDTVESAEKAIYKGTECGAWIIFDEEGVSIGSIVEGSEAEVGPEHLAYPFVSERFWEELEEINITACELWEEANYEFNDDEIFV